METFTAGELIDALEEVWASIATLTGPLDEQAYAKATDCPGWDVKDQLSHMIGTERSLQGEATPEVSLGRRDHLKNAIGEANERWVESRRARSGSQVRDEFIEVTQGRLASLRAMPPTAFEAVGWSPIGQVPLRVFLEVRAMDCWMHEQDIRLALDLPGGRGAAGERLSLHRADQALGSVIGKAVRPADGTSIALEITGPIPGRRRIEMVGGRAMPIDGPSATSTITMEALCYLERFGGRISLSEALEAEGTDRAGDTALGEAFLGALAVMI
jgi:uncharacterized protein (TIGR03083 family)